MQTMQAIRAHTRGGPDHLIFEDAPVPVPADDEALVKVHAAAITYDELTWEETWTRNGADRTPIIPAHEVSGTVVAVGSAVSGLSVGDDVYGLIEFDRDGAAAEYVTVRAADLATKPASIDHVHAAAVPLAALTAWQALRDHARIEPGESLLVLGGAGGVGGYVVQLGRHVGARVAATVRSDDTSEYVRRLGADDVIVRPASGLFDVVVDTVGGPVLAEAYPFVCEGGRLITLQPRTTPGPRSPRRVLRGAARPQPTGAARSPR
jgi:NADPH:quinone reductase-like Zn-dependent oxidoreductase